MMMISPTFRGSLRAVKLAALAAGCAAALAAGARAQQQDTTSYAEVVIKGETISKFPLVRPKLAFDFDPMDALSPLLEPDDKLFLSDSPITFDWKRNRPEVLHVSKIIRPQWYYLIAPVETSFDMAAALARIVTPPPPKEWFAGLQWELNIISDDGIVFHKISGAGRPPDTVKWNGQNQSGQWARAGHAYNAFVSFTDASGAVTSGPAQPAQLRASVKEIAADPAQLRDVPGLPASAANAKSALVPAIEVDSSLLFGSGRDALAINKDKGIPALSAVADIIRIRYPGRSFGIICYAPSKAMGEEQAGLVRDYLADRLTRPPDSIQFSGSGALPTEQQLLVFVK